MYKFKTLDDFNFQNKAVLLRADFNLPVDDQGRILNDRRIRAVVPTINYLLENNVKLILATHFGRPKGEIVENLRVDKISQRVAKLINKPVQKIDSTSGSEVEEAIQKMNNSDILMLENIQFDPGEIENSDDYAQKLASYADIFVLEAFGQSHRDYASLSGIQKFIPSCAGYLIQKEIEKLDSLLEKTQHPFYAIIGGAKADKIGVIKSLMNKVDKFIIGGALANTFLKAQGLNIGNSKFDLEILEFAQELIKTNPEKIVLPSDVVVAKEFNNQSNFRNIAIKDIESREMILDIGKGTTKRYQEILKNAQMIVWAGTMGVFEFSNFQRGTEKIAEFISKLEAVTVIGGGDTSSVIEDLKLVEKMNHVSTGGGAALGFLAGNELPALKALEENALHYK